MPIAAGRLKEIAAIQRPERTPNGSGGFTTEYVDVLNPMYCDVIQKQPSVDVIASQEKILQLFEFVTRYRTDLEFQIGDRILWRDRHFVLMGFRWDINRIQLIITARVNNDNTSDGSGT